MQLAQLKALAAVADHGGISAAARSLEMSQPTITRTIKQLERELGVALLVRDSTGFSLTRYGNALLTHGRLILDETRRAREHIEQMLGERSGELSIASSAVTTALVIPKAISILAEEFPGVHVNLREAVYPTVLPLFRDAAIDFAIGPVPSEGMGREYKTELIFHVERAVVVRRGHPHERARSLVDLANLNWMVSGPVSGPGDVHDMVFRSFGLPPPRNAMHCESLSGAFHVIQHSDIASIVALPMVAIATTATNSISVVPIKERLPSVPIHLTMHKQRILTPAGKALYSAIRSVGRSLR